MKHKILKLIFGGVLLAGIAGVAVPSASAQGKSYRNMSCGQLWYARNAIYARKGFCFKSVRARRNFGPRCYPPYGRLNARQQRRVNNIRRWERRKGCR